MKYLAEKILFVKPMEIESSYSSFDKIWTNLKKIISGSEGFYSSALYRSIDYNAKYGFVSFSAWDDKTSFSKAVKKNLALKYHIGKNKDGRKSDYSHLFKVVNHNHLKSGKNGSTNLILNFLEDDNNGNDFVLEHWKKLNDFLLNRNILESSYLCKSLYPYSRFKYVILAYINNNLPGVESSINVSDIIKSQFCNMKECNYSIYSNNFKKILNSI